MRKLLFLAALATVAAFAASIANASPVFLTEFQAKYPNTINITCGACHTTQNPSLSGDWERNRYGAAFAIRAHGTPSERSRAFLLLEKLDSDRDGYTNLTEIVATTPAIKVLPGFAAPNPAFPAAEGFRPRPTRLLFFDNFSNITATSIPNWRFTDGVWGGSILAGNKYLTSPLAAAKTFANPAPPVPLPALTGFGAGSIEARVQLISVADGDQVDVVFALTPATYRLVGISGDEISIGQDGGSSKRIPSAVFGDFQPHLLKITIGPQTATGSVVTVYVDGTLIGARRFSSLSTGQVGFRTKLTRARFDNMRISK